MELHRGRDGAHVGPAALGGRVTLTSAAPADPTLLSLHFGWGDLLSSSD